MVGLPVEVQVRDGSAYAGVLHTASVEGGYGGRSSLSPPPPPRRCFCGWVARLGFGDRGDVVVSVIQLCVRSG